MATTNTNTTNTQIPQEDPLAAVASYLSSVSAGRANGRLQEALLNTQHDQLANQQFGQTSTNASDAAKFGLNAPNVRAGQSVRGDILANSQDATVSGLPSYIHVGQVSGGLRPSMLSDNTRQFGQGLSRNALASQMAGGDKIDFPTAPTLTPVPQASALDSVLNTGSGIAGFLSALNKLGGGNGASGGGDITKAGLAAIKNKLAAMFGGGNTPTMSTPGDPLLGANDLNNDFTGWDTPSEPVPSVTTDTTFGGVPGGYPNNPEDPASANQNWWEQLPGWSG